MERNFRSQNAAAQHGFPRQVRYTDGGVISPDIRIMRLVMMTWLTASGVYLLTGVAAALAALYLWACLSRYVGARAAKAVPLEALKDRAGRVSKLRAKLATGAPVMAPISQRPVGYARITIEELLADGAYEPVAETQLGSTLRLCDGERTVNVLLGGAHVTITQAGARTIKDLADVSPDERAELARLVALPALPAAGRVIEEVLAENENVLVYGTPEPLAGASLAPSPYRDAAPAQSLMTARPWSALIVADDERALAESYADLV